MATLKFSIIFMGALSGVYGFKAPKLLLQKHINVEKNTTILNASPQSKTTQNCFLATSLIKLYWWSLYRRKIH